MFHPVEKANELIKDINSMVESGVDELKAARIRREALKLEQAGMLVNAKQVLGMLAAFNGDAAKVDEMFAAARNASGNDPVVVLNHAVAQANLRRLRNAVQTSKVAVERMPDNVDLLLESLRLNLDAFNTIGAMDLATRIRRLGKPMSEKSERQLEAKAKVLLENCVSWEEVSERIEMASDVLKQRGFSPMRCKVHETFGDSAMLYEFLLPASADEAADAEDAIVQAIAERPYSRVDNAIVFYCVSA